jgi:uncharacterized MnhB-related membrane protein
MNIKGIQFFRLAIGSLMVAAVLAGCSAGGKGSDTTTTTTTASSLSVSVDKSSISSTGSATATITVTALDANNNVVSSAPVSIKPDSGVLTPSATTTSSAGVVTGALTIGSDHSNRTINVIVTSGSIKKALTVTVTGGSLSATVGSATAGSTATIQYALVDAGSLAIANASITVGLSGQANVVGTTDANGKYTFSYAMPSVSTAVTATAAGVTTTSTVTPANGTTAIANAGTVTSPSLAANPTTVSTGGPVELRALFIGTSNAPIQNVRVRFQMLDTNSIGGTLSSDATDGTHNVIYSDANGVAGSTYTAGTRGGVITPTVCWSATDFVSATDCPHQVTASSVTVVAGGVSVAVLTNSILGVDNTKNIYSLSFVVQVVDASNQPISGSTVTGAVDIPRFYRGTYSSGSGTWVAGIYSDRTLATLLNGTESCDNEDVNRNNVMESGEDLNDSGALEPFKASVTIAPTTTGSDVTDAYGKAYFTLQYGQNYASWEDVALTFTTTVAGTEGHAPYASGLPVPSSALTTITADPPFKVSPYNVIQDGLAYPWLVGKTAVANPGVIYPTTPTFNLCKPQQ